MVKQMYGHQPIIVPFVYVHSTKRAKLACRRTSAVPQRKVLPHLDNYCAGGKEHAILHIT